MSTETDDTETEEADRAIVTSQEVEDDDIGDGAGDEEAEIEAEPAPIGAAEAEADEPPAKTRQPWHVKRLGKVVAERDDLKSKLEAAEAKLAAQGGEDGAKLFTEDEVRQRIETEASQKSRIRELDTRLDTMFETGAKAHKDFVDRVQGYVKAFGVETLQARQDFFEAVSELPNGADVIHALGGDLDQMGDILEMPPYKMGMALAQLSSELAKPKGAVVSKVPAPIVPLERTTVSELDIADPRLPMDEYVRRRQEARAVRKQSGRR